MITDVKRICSGFLAMLIILLAACSHDVLDSENNVTNIPQTIAGYEVNEIFSEQKSDIEIDEKSIASDSILEMPLPFGYILYLLDDFCAYINYLDSVRDLETYFYMVFRFERLYPDGSVVNTPLNNVISMYEELNKVFEFVSLSSHLNLGYIGEYSNGVEFVNISPSFSIEEEMNRWVENDGFGNSFYYTPLKTLFLSSSSFHRLDNHISLGRNLKISDGRASRDEPISIVLGAAYKDIYEIGDILSLYYITKIMDFKVVGFLNHDVNFHYGLGAHEKILLDYRIVVPHFIPEYEPIGDAEIWQIAFHVGELLSGFVLIETDVSDIQEDTWVYYQSIVEEIAITHGLSDVIGFDSLPSGIIWPN